MGGYAGSTRDSRRLAIFRRHARAGLALLAALTLTPPRPRRLAGSPEVPGCDGDDEGAGSEGGLAEALGSIAAWGGGVSTLGFVLFGEAYPGLAGLGIRLPRGLYRGVLRLHAYASLVLGLLGLYHGFLLRSSARPVEYALAGLVVFTLASGATMWLSRGDTRRLARAVHVQRLLAAALLILP